MRIENGRVSGVRFRRAKYSGGEMAPKQVILHDTAGALRKFSSVEWFEKPDRQVSAHFVIERDGTVTQMVETNRVAYHAGQSKLGRQTGLNSSSIGIEIVNPGRLNEKGEAQFSPGKWTKIAEASDVEFKSTPEHGSHHWLPYTDAQIAAAKLLCTLIVEEYPDCNEILTHYQISPGRKIDVNPLFPLREVRKAVLDPDPETAEKIEEVVAPPVAAVTKTSAAKEMVVEGAKSKTVQWSIAGLFAWLETQLGFFQGMLPDAQKQAGDIVNPLTSLGGMLKIKLGGALVVIVVLVLIVVIYRHSRDKVELKKLKGE